jgi:hypothetical protein
LMCKEVRPSVCDAALIAFSLGLAKTIHL